MPRVRGDPPLSPIQRLSQPVVEVCGLSPPTVPVAGFIDNVLDRTLACLDIDALRDDLIGRLADKLVSTVRVDRLVDMLVPRIEEALSEHLCNRIAEQLIAG